jgi:hypothetical protein
MTDCFYCKEHDYSKHYTQNALPTKAHEISANNINILVRKTKMSHKTMKKCLLFSSLAVRQALHGTG